MVNYTFLGYYFVSILVELYFWLEIILHETVRSYVEKSPLYHVYFLNLLCYLAIFTFSTDLCRVDGVEEVQYEISRIKQKSK